MQRWSEKKAGKTSVGTHTSSLTATARRYTDPLKCSALMCYQWQQSVSLLNDFLNMVGGVTEYGVGNRSPSVSIKDLGNIIQNNTKKKLCNTKKDIQVILRKIRKGIMA